MQPCIIWKMDTYISVRQQWYDTTMNIVASSMYEKNPDGDPMTVLMTGWPACESCWVHGTNNSADRAPGCFGSIEDKVALVSHSTRERHFTTSMNSVVRRKSSSTAKSVAFVTAYTVTGEACRTHTCFSCG